MGSHGFFLIRVFILVQAACAKLSKRTHAAIFAPDDGHSGDVVQTCGGTTLGARFLAFPGDKVSNLSVELSKFFCPVIHHKAERNTLEDLQSWRSQHLIDEGSPAIIDLPDKKLMKYASVHWSVRDMWSKHLQSPDDVAVFFEEDARLRADFGDRYEAILAVVADKDADLIYLNHCDEYCQTGGIDIGGDTTLAPATFPNCAAGYILNKKGARVLLDRTMPMKDFYDNDMREACRDGHISCFSVCPRIVKQGWQSFDLDHKPLPWFAIYLCTPHMHKPRFEFLCDKSGVPNVMRLALVTVAVVVAVIGSALQLRKYSILYKKRRSKT